jgi:hypothetical protein
MVEAWGLIMFPRDVCIMPKDEVGLRLIDMETQGSIWVAKWVIHCLEESSP